jgi:hypothetical protein
VRTYRVVLPPQSSPLTGLRLDPLRSPGEIRIESIRVLPEPVGTQDGRPVYRTGSGTYEFEVER